MFALLREFQGKTKAGAKRRAQRVLRVFAATGAQLVLRDPNCINP
jgi:hypothetical protein